MSYLSRSAFLALSPLLLTGGASAEKLPVSPPPAAPQTELAVPEAEQEASAGTSVSISTDDVQAFIASNNMQAIPVSVSGGASSVSPMIMAFDGAGGCFKYDARQNGTQVMQSSLALVAAARAVEQKIAANEVPEDIKTARGIYVYYPQSHAVQISLAGSVDFNAASICGPDRSSQPVPDDNFEDVRPAPPMRMDPRTIA
ncbi:MAG: hypothetical protein AB7E85_06655 [Pseudobdellovibrionaceae bacterium]